MISLKKILVATDFGEAADAALAYGRELGRSFNARLDVVHVVENILTRGFGAEGYVASYPELQEEVEEAATRQLNSILSAEDRDVLRATTTLLKSNSPAFALVTYAKENDVDLIIMGTHGRGAFAHLLMGSVAERVVRTAPCPVLTVRHPEHEFVLPDALVAVAKV
jgi:nucleotide-binding universal stress UspA family protein